MEPRGIVAEPAARGGGLTVWASTQVPHWLQRTLCEMLELPAHKLRVVAPEVGGGFGTKASVYPEDVLIPAIAARLDRPVKWIETRREHMQSAAHARRAAARRRARRDAATARSLAFRDRFLARPGRVQPVGHRAALQHRRPHPRARTGSATPRSRARAVVTNKTPARAVPRRRPARGRLRDGPASSTCWRASSGIDPARAPAAQPDPAGRAALRRGDAVPRRQPARLRRRRLPRRRWPGPCGRPTTRRCAPSRRRSAARGSTAASGISCYVEGTAIGPYEGATVRLDASGKVLVATGACSQGQGHETSFAQIAADALGVGLEDVTVIGGDTDGDPVRHRHVREPQRGPRGERRSPPPGRAVRAKLVRAAAPAPRGRRGRSRDRGRAACSCAGSPGRAVPLREHRARQPADVPGAGRPSTPDFEATAYHHVPTVTYASAVHVARGRGRSRDRAPSTCSATSWPTTAAA